MPREIRQQHSSPDSSATYTNRVGDVYYLHEGRTKTGKVRYFVAKTIRQGALAAMPNGFEFCESVNAVVSVRRIDPSAPRIPAADLALARAEMARYAHLRRYRVDEIKAEIVVFEPEGGMFPDVIAEMDEYSRMRREHFGDQVGGGRLPVRYTPVMKFVPSTEPGSYCVHRMTYRGHGGWSRRLIKSGTLSVLLGKYLPCLGTDEFFELF